MKATCKPGSQRRVHEKEEYLPRPRSETAIRLGNSIHPERRESGNRDNQREARAKREKKTPGLHGPARDKRQLPFTRVASPNMLYVEQILLLANDLE